MRVDRKRNERDDHNSSLGDCTDLGTDSVKTRWFSSGLVGNPFSGSGCGEDVPGIGDVLFFQRGREYDFFTSRGILEGMTGSGMSMHWSSKRTLTISISLFTAVTEEDEGSDDCEDGSNIALVVV